MTNSEFNAAKIAQDIIIECTKNMELILVQDDDEDEKIVVAELYDNMLTNCVTILVRDFLNHRYTPWQFKEIRNRLGYMLKEAFDWYTDEREKEREEVADLLKTFTD